MTGPVDPAPRYWAFISYSSRDRAIATRLHRSLEAYRIPSRLVGRRVAGHTVPRRLMPIFRDRDELTASGDLGAVLNAALAQSRFLIVVCSPNAVASRWVNDEIAAFKCIHGEGRALAFIVKGEPFASDRPASAHIECFPPALRSRVAAGGAIGSERAEPLAADIRDGMDGWQLARLKLVAGIAGVGLDDLTRRDQQRRQRRLAVVAAGSFGASVVTGGLALYANRQRIEADHQRRVAVREAQTAKTTSEFLLRSFADFEPTTANPRKTTVETLLNASFTRVRRELVSEPAVQARLMGALGGTYNKLGLTATTRREIGAALPRLRRAGPIAADALLTLSQAEMLDGDLDGAARHVREAKGLLGPDRAAIAIMQARMAARAGEIAYMQSDLVGAIASFEHARRLYALAPVVPPGAMGDLFGAEGVTLSDAGRRDQAGVMLDQALQARRRALGDHHLQTAKSWYALGSNDVAQGNFALAAERLSRALAIEREILDADNPTIGDTLVQQGLALQGLGRLPGARATMRQALSIYDHAYHGRHFLIGTTDVYLALIESATGRTKAALALMDLAEAQYDASYGRLNANHGDLKVNRAMVLAKAGRRTEAARECAEGVAILLRLAGDEVTKPYRAQCATLRTDRSSIGNGKA